MIAASTMTAVHKSGIQMKAMNGKASKASVSQPKHLRINIRDLLG
jgi:hypothetical protein